MEIARLIRNPKFIWTAGSALGGIGVLIASHFIPEEPWLFDFGLAFLAVGPLLIWIILEMR